MSGQEPEDAVPFTHQPYGEEQEENPFTSPSGPAAQPSGPSHVTPPTPPPPVTGPPPAPPYGPPARPAPEPWQAAWAPTYGVPQAGILAHKGATTAMVLGVVAVASLVLGLFCCFTLPGVICAPFAWVIGAQARREIDRTPNTYVNRGFAQAGMVMGITVTILGTLAAVGTAVFVILIG